MKKLAASLLVSLSVLAAAASPALAQTKHTELVNGKGESVDSLLLQWRFDATWVIDQSRILMRDVNRDHYLVTLKDTCEKLDMDRGVNFSPALTGRLYASLQYQVRDKVGPYCEIGKVEKVNDEAAASLRAELTAKSKNG